MAPSPRIVLVQPSEKGGVRSLFSFHKGDGLGRKPPQSVMILATLLRARGFDDTSCIDAQLLGYSPQDTVDKLLELKPDIVGMTVWTDFWHPAWLTVKLLREQLPDTIIVLGGPHCTVYPEETLIASKADFVVAGDGEDVLHAIVEDCAANIPVRDLPGTWRYENGAVIAPPVPLAAVSDITTIPPPDRRLLDFRKYTSVLGSSDFETTMITSRGCPYKCTFCKIDVQKVYARTAEQVVEEFRQIADLGITDVQIYDDTFSWGRQRVIDICNGLIDNRIDVRWAIRDRANRADPELYKLMKKAGAYRIHFGVETGSPRILKETGKFLTLDQVETAMKYARDAGLATIAYYMFGFPDETMADAEMTLEFARKLNADYSAFAVLIPYPGTAIYRLGQERGIIPTDFWGDFALRPEPDFVIPSLMEDHLSRKELLDLKNTALRRIYLTPRRVLKEMAGIRSWAELNRKASMAYHIAVDAMGMAEDGPQHRKSSP